MRGLIALIIVTIILIIITMSYQINRKNNTSTINDIENQSNNRISDSIEKYVALSKTSGEEVSGDATEEIESNKDKIDELLNNFNIENEDTNGENTKDNGIIFIPADGVTIIDTDISDVTDDSGEKTLDALYTLYSGEFGSGF